VLADVVVGSTVAFGGRSAITHSASVLSSTWVHSRGPLLFVLYTADLSQVVANHGHHGLVLRQYAHWHQPRRECWGHISAHWHQPRRECWGTHQHQYFGWGDVNELPIGHHYSLNLAPQTSPKYAISRSRNKKFSGNGALPHPLQRFVPPTSNSRCNDATE